MTDFFIYQIHASLLVLQVSLTVFNTCVYIYFILDREIDKPLNSSMKLKIYMGLPEIDGVLFTEKDKGTPSDRIYN